MNFNIDFINTHIWPYCAWFIGAHYWKDTNL